MLIDAIKEMFYRLICSVTHTLTTWIGTSTEGSRYRTDCRSTAAESQQTEGEDIEGKVYTEVTEPPMVQLNVPSPTAVIY